MGIGEGINQISMGYLMSVNRKNKTVNFGAADKSMAVNCNEAITEGLPCVGVGSRNTTEVHAVMNGKVGIYSSEIKEPYATNPYNMKGAAAIDYSDSGENICSFVFFCKDYMMTEEELLAVNKIFYDLMVALW